MSDDQLAALASFGVPALFVAIFLLGRWSGARWALKRVESYRKERIQRWTPAAPQVGGAPGSVLRLVSDYEDAIFAAARHNVVAQYGDDDERHHAEVAADLHAQVRRLRGEVLARAHVESPEASGG